MDPDTQYLVARPQTGDLDDVISKLAEDIDEMEASIKFCAIKGSYINWRLYCCVACAGGIQLEACGLWQH